MRSQLPKSIWALGIVSLFMDVSSELIHSLLPVFMVSALSASMLDVGAIEGIAEATAMITKIFSGGLSDKTGKRKFITLIGYGMSACTKPLFPLAHSIEMVLAARFVDRVGKGVRGAPRDALISDITPQALRGEAFGLRQSLDTVGAVIGPLLAMGLMLLLHNHIRAVLWLAAVPAALAVITLALGVQEPDAAGDASARPAMRLRDICHIGHGFWPLVGVAGALTLARFSEAFLILKAQAVGLPVAFVPLVLVVMSTVYALSAYPVGKLSDRMSRPSLLFISALFLLAADLALAAASGIPMLALGVALWGLHMGFSQGLLSAMVSHAAPAHLRGTAFGAYNGACGLALLIASLIAGALWDKVGTAATFLAGAGFTVLAIMGLALLRKSLVASAEE